jgi:cytochrome c
MVRDLTMSAVILAAFACPALAQDPAAGEAAFRKCQPCHDVGETAKNKLGPELNGLDGKKAGIAEGYAYSDGNKNSSGARRPSRSTSRTHKRRYPAQR